MTRKFVLVEIVLVETVLVGDPLYLISLKTGIYTALCSAIKDPIEKMASGLFLHS